MSDNHSNSVLFTTYLFYTRFQKNEENFDDFFKDLIGLALACNFENGEKRVRDQVMVGIRDNQIRGILISLGDPTLSEVVEVLTKNKISNIHNLREFFQYEKLMVDVNSSKGQKNPTTDSNKRAECVKEEIQPSTSFNETQVHNRKLIQNEVTTMEVVTIKDEKKRGGKASSKVKCGRCKKLFKNLSCLASHKRSHKIICKFCHVSFPTYYQLHKHMKTQNCASAPDKSQDLH